MKSGDWLFIIMRSLDRVRILRLEKRTLIILTLGGVFLAGALAFFAHEYFTLINERSNLINRVQQLTNQITLLEKSVQKAVWKKNSTKVTLPSLAIEDLKVSRRAKRGGFSVSFQLINQNPQKHPVTGTLAMVAQNETLRNPIYRVVPEMRLNNNIPLEPEKGKKFQVEKQKFIEAFFDGSSGVVFKTLTIFVYSQEGKLILEKSVAIPEG